MSLTSISRPFLRLQIRNKIAVTLSAILLLVAVLGFASVTLINLRETVDRLTGDSLIGMDELSSMREALLRYRLAIARYVTAKNLTPDFDATTNKAIASFRQHEVKYAATVGTPEE